MADSQHIEHATTRVTNPPRALSWQKKQEILSQMRGAGGRKSNPKTKRTKKVPKRDSKGRFVKSSRSRRSTRRTTRRSPRRRRNAAKLAGVPVKSGLQSGAAFAAAVYLASTFTNLVQRHLIDRIPVRWQGASMLVAAVVTGMGGMSLQKKYRDLPVSLFFWGLSAPLFYSGLNTLGLIPAANGAAAIDTTAPPPPVDTETAGMGGTYQLAAPGQMGGTYARRGSMYGNAKYGMSAVM